MQALREHFTIEIFIVCSTLVVISSFLLSAHSNASAHGFDYRRVCSAS